MNFIEMVIAEIMETFKRIMDFVQYVFGGAMKAPWLAIGLLVLLFAGKGKKELSLGKLFNVKL